MHGNYREPINKKYLVISLIGVAIFAIILSIFTFKYPSKTATAPSSKPKVEYTAIKKNLDHKFNENGRIVQIKEEHNINDSTSKQSHTVIIIKLTDKQTQKYLKETYEAVQNNQASDDQKMYIYSIQKIVADEAKKLDNQYDVIQFVYKDGTKYIPIASSQKNRFLIAPVKISNNQSTQKAAQ